MNVGDKVWYFPDKIHATHRDASKQFPWRLGRRDRDDSPVTELHGKQLADFVEAARKNPKGREAKSLALIAPRHGWAGTVLAANEDGTVDLDIVGSQGGVTLHYHGVKVSKGREPHTCCQVEAESPATQEPEPEGGE